MTKTSNAALRAALLVTASLQVAADESGCQQSESSDVVRQDRIWTGYWTFYDAQGDTTDLRASFRLGSETGTPLILESPASVSALGQPLSFDPVWDGHAGRVAGPVAEGAYDYVNLDGDAFSVALRPFRRAEVPSTFARVLDATQAQALEWQGPAIRENEFIEVIVASAQNRLAPRIFVERTVGATSTVLDARSLGVLPRGAGVLFLRRTYIESVKSTPGAGGQIRTTWQSPVFDIEIQ